MHTDTEYTILDWNNIIDSVKSGELGFSTTKELKVNDMKYRMIDYSPGYLADHWCQKGHIVFVLEGELISELSDGSSSILSKGMGYVVSDHLSTHRSRTDVGAKLLIIDSI